MVRYRATINVAHSTDKVWKLLSNWTNLALWDINVKEMIPIEAEGVPKAGVGAMWDCKFEFNGRKTDAKYRCVEYTEPTKAIFEASSPFVRSKDTLQIKQGADANSSQVTMQFELYLRGLLSPLSFLLDGAMQSTCPQVMKDLEGFVDEQLGSQE